MSHVVDVSSVNTDPHAISTLVGLHYHGRDFYAARVRTAEEALRRCQTRMARDRASRYRAVVGTHLLDRLAFELVLNGYPSGRRYGLDRCREIRAALRETRDALAVWDAAAMECAA